MLLTETGPDLLSGKIKPYTKLIKYTYTYIYIHIYTLEYIEQQNIDYTVRSRKNDKPVCVRVYTWEYSSLINRSSKSED